MVCTKHGDLLPIIKLGSSEHLWQHVCALHRVDGVARDKFRSTRKHHIAMRGIMKSLDCGGLLPLSMQHLLQLLHPEASFLQFAA